MAAFHRHDDNSMPEDRAGAPFADSWTRHLHRIVWSAEKTLP